MRAVVVLLACMTCASLLSLVAAAQNGPGPGHMHMHSDAPTQDTREFVPMPPQMVAHTLSNMRDHLLALQEIQENLARGETDRAAKVAEARLGMSSLTTHGAADVAPFMPQGMQDAGTGMHHAASRFALAATDAGVSGDLKPALAALALVTAQCNACHSSYRIR